MWRSKLFWKIFFSFALSTLVVLTIAGLLIYRNSRHKNHQELTEQLSLQSLLLSNQFAPLLEQSASPQATQQINQTVQTISLQSQTRITIILKDGRVIADSHVPLEKLGNHRDRPEVLAALANGVGIATRLSDSTHQKTTYFARAIPNIGVVRVAYPTEQIEAEKKELLWSLSKYLLLAWGLALFLGGTIAARISQTLRQRAESTNKQAKELEQNRLTMIEQDRAQLQAILSGMTEGVIAIDEQARLRRRF
jgi:two-component system phosphate regulon sensor histidine kinase PhoR